MTFNLDKICLELVVNGGDRTGRRATLDIEKYSFAEKTNVDSDTGLQDCEAGQLLNRALMVPPSEWKQTNIEIRIQFYLNYYSETQQMSRWNMKQ